MRLVPLMTNLVFILLLSSPSRPPVVPLTTSRRRGEVPAPPRNSSSSSPSPPPLPPRSVPPSGGANPPLPLLGATGFLQTCINGLQLQLVSCFPPPEMELTAAAAAAALEGFQPIPALSAVAPASSVNSRRFSAPPDYLVPML